MKISNRFTIAVHMLAMMALGGDETLTSERMAGSVNTNPVIIRRIAGMLKKAGLIEVKAGVGGARILHDLNTITLKDVYTAVGVVDDLQLFNVHTSPNPRCPVGANITRSLNGTLAEAQHAMEAVLENTTLAQIVFTLTRNIEAGSASQKK